jgi:hypothetical protein
MRALAVVALIAGFPLITSPSAKSAGGDPLVDRMNRFAATYRRFVDQHDHGVFDVALAKKLSREWREVEASGEWPRGDSR